MFKSTPSRLLPFILAILLTSCASSYRTIRPSSLSYPSIDNSNSFSYKYNVLKDRRDNKYAKKEDKFKTRIVAVKIVNNTDRVLKYGDNYRIFSGSDPIRILEPEVAAYSLRQKVPTYLLYLLLSGSTLNTGNTYSNGNNGFPIGYILGPGLAGINMIMASGANKKLREDLEQNTVLGRDIKVGETFYGLIGIVDNGFMPLSIKLMK